MKQNSKLVPWGIDFRDGYYAVKQAESRKQAAEYAETICERRGTTVEKIRRVL